MSDHNKQIVCISTHYWDDSWFRKQQFMSRFVKNGYKVAYIEPSFSIVRRPDEDKRKFQTNRPFKVIVEKKNENLFILKPPQGIPFLSRPEVSRINYMYFSLRLKNVLEELGFFEYVLWIYGPEYASGLDIFDYKKLVFDLVDDLSAYRGEDNKKYNYVEKCINQIIRRSDLLIVTASALFEKYESASKKICLVPNGFDLDMFSGKAAARPDDIKEIRSPIIGFIGTLFSFLDYELLEFIISSNPDMSFVFIGALEDNARNEWAGIVKHENVFWLGKKKKQDIPSYLNAFDVCINPFKVNDVSRSVSPLKVFEYLAAKKPVVSVKMESLEKEEVAPYIYFASSYQDFDKKLNEALAQREMIDDRMNYQVVMKYSWDNLYKKVQDSLMGI